MSYLFLSIIMQIGFNESLQSFKEGFSNLTSQVTHTLKGDPLGPLVFLPGENLKT